MKKSVKILLGIVYWLISLTWGFLLTFVGLLVSLFALLFLKGKPHKNGFSYIVEVGGNWGGISLGAISLCGSYMQENKGCYNPYWFEHTRRHEFGHSLQHLILGPFMLFVVAIPSATRYWYQRIRTSKGLPNTEYDQIWFEYTASKYGYLALNKLENKEMEYTFKRK